MDAMGGTTTPPIGCFVLCDVFFLSPVPQWIERFFLKNEFLKVCTFVTKVRVSVAKCVPIFYNLRVFIGGDFLATNKKRVTVSLSPGTEKSLDFICERMGVSKSAAVAYAVNSFVIEKLGRNSEVGLKNK